MKLKLRKMALTAVESVQKSMGGEFDKRHSAYVIRSFFHFLGIVYLTTAFCVTSKEVLDEY